MALGEDERPSSAVRARQALRSHPSKEAQQPATQMALECQRESKPSASCQINYINRNSYLLAAF